MLKSLLFIIFLQQILAVGIYPLYNQKGEIQWELNIWVDCQTKEEISPQKCDSNEQNWQECYGITSNGICLKQSIGTTISGTTTIKVQFYESIGQEVKIEVNGISHDGKLVNNYLKLTQDITTNQIDIKVLKTESSAEIKLNGLFISSGCDYNCGSCNEETNTCKECETGFWEYNFICTTDSCTDQISNLSTQTHKSSFSQIEQSTSNYQITSKFDVPLVDCFVAKIYLTKSLDDNSVIYVLNETQITRDSTDNTLLTYYLTPQQYQQYCSTIETNDSIYYQCFIGLSITVNKVPQFLLLLLGQIQVNRSTSAITDQLQIFEMPTGDDSSIIGPVIIISDADSTTIDNSNQLIQTSQTVADPTYSSYQATFFQGYVEQNDTVLPLTLENQNQDGSTTQYTLSYDNSNLNTNYNYTITIGSTLQQQQLTRRRLLGTRNIVAKLQMSNSISYSSGQISQSPISLESFNQGNQKASLKGGYLALIFVFVFLVSILLTNGSLIIKDKIQEKYFKLSSAPIQQPVQTQQPIHQEQNLNTDNQEQQNQQI